MSGTHGPFYISDIKVYNIGYFLKIGQISNKCKITNIQSTHTHPFKGPLSGSTPVSQYQKGKTDLDFTGARDSEWQWHQLGDMQVCISLQTDNHASTSLLKHTIMIHYISQYLS